MLTDIYTSISSIVTKVSIACMLFYPFFFDKYIKMQFILLTDNLYLHLLLELILNKHRGKQYKASGKLKQNDVLSAYFDDSILYTLFLSLIARSLKKIKRERIIR